MPFPRHIRLTPQTWVSLVLVGGSAALVGRTLFVGIDFNDECYHIALSDQLVRGARPFVDELNLTAVFSLLVRPLQWAFLAVQGSTEGLLRFSRLSWFLITLIFFLFASFQWARRFGGVLAISVGALILTPDSIRSLNYTWLGSVLWTVSLLLLAVRAQKPAPLRWALAGATLALTVIAYLPLLIPVCAFALWSLFRARPFRVQQALAMTIGGLSVITVIGLGYSISLSDLAFHTQYHVPDYKTKMTSKVVYTLRVLWQWRPKDIVSLGLLATPFAVVLGGRGKWRALALAAGIQPVLWYVGSHSQLGVLNFQLIAIAFSAPFFWALLGWRSGVGRWFTAFWLPSLAAFCFKAIASNAFFLGSNLYVLPMVMTSFALMALWIRKEAAPWGKRRARWLSALPIWMLLPSALLSQSNGMIGYDPDVHSSPRIFSAGPFKGMTVGAPFFDYYEALRLDVASLEQKYPGGEIAFLPRLPAGYLLSTRKNTTVSVWSSCDEGREDKCLAHFLKRLTPNTLIFDVRRWPTAGFMVNDGSPSSIEWSREILATYPTVLERENYRVLVPRP